MNWLKINWTELQKFGATSFQLWNSTENGEHVLFCKYTVNNMQRWIHHAPGPHAASVTHPLSDYVDMDKTSLKITVIADSITQDISAESINN